MKNFCLLTVMAILLNACSTPLWNVFIDSNVSADVYVGDKKVGQTPFYGNLHGADINQVTLRKKGYETAPLIKSNDKNEPYFIHLKGKK